MNLKRLTIALVTPMLLLTQAKVIMCARSPIDERPRFI